MKKWSHATKPINWDEVDKYAEAHVSGSNIAKMFGVVPKTLYERCLSVHGMLWSEYQSKKKESGTAKMEYAIYKNALENGGSERIFWLKNKAGWRDVWDVNNTIINEDVLTISDEELLRRINQIVTTPCEN